MNKYLFSLLLSLFSIGFAICQTTVYYNSKGKVITNIEKADYYIITENDSTCIGRKIDRKFNKLKQIQSEYSYYLKEDNSKIIDGVYKQWYESGKLHVITEFNNGRLNGWLRSYSENGTVLRAEEYKNGAYLFDGKPLHSDPANVIMEVVEQMPIYPGGQDAISKYIKENLIYPEKSKNDDISGKVIVRFVVKRNGEVDYVHIIRGLDNYCNDEAVRLVKSLKGWSPGKLEGLNVSTLYTLPIPFGI